MNEPLVSEDTDLDRLLAQIKSEHGDAADILYQDSVRRGGVMGFFAQEVHRVVYRVNECADISPRPAAQVHPFQSLLNERMVAKQSQTPSSPELAVTVAPTKTAPVPAVVVKATTAKTPAATAPAVKAPAVKAPAVKAPAVKAPKASATAPVDRPGQDSDDAWLEELLAPIEAHDFEHTEPSKVSSYQFPRAEPPARTNVKKSKTTKSRAKALPEPEPETEMAVLEASPLPMTAQERFAELIKTMHELEPEISAEQSALEIANSKIAAPALLADETPAADDPQAVITDEEAAAAEIPAAKATAVEIQHAEVTEPEPAATEPAEADLDAAELQTADIDTAELETADLETADLVTVEVPEVPVTVAETQVDEPVAEVTYRGSHSSDAIAESTATPSAPEAMSTGADAQVDENAEVVDLPATGSSDARARMDLLVRLHEVGIPAGLHPSTEATNVFQALDEILLQLADVPVPPRAAGDVLLIVGDLAPATRAAQSVARTLRLPESEIRIADARTSADPNSAELRITNPRKAQRVRGELADADVASVIVLATDGSDAGHADPWVGDMIEALAPTAVWACVDATRKSSDTIAKLMLLGEIDALVVHSAAISTSPASVWDIGVPVALLDDRAATAAAWAGLLLGLLADNARHSNSGHASATETETDLPRARHRSA